MNTNESVPVQCDVHQILASAVAHQVERMSKEEVQALVAKSQLELQDENAALKKRIEQLEAENSRLAWQFSRSLFNEKDYETFDPSQYTVPVEEVLAAIDAIKE
jgi:cell division protein FtsB